MPRFKEVSSLVKISLNGVCKLVDVYGECVVRRSYELYHRQEGATSDKEVAEWIDSQVEWLQGLLFSSVPWYHYQSLVDSLILWLTEAVQSSKVLFRRPYSPPRNIHRMHVLLRFVQLIVHPRVKSLDLSRLPKVLRDALYRELDKLTGLERLLLGSGNGESARKKSFLAFKYLTNLTYISMANDCQNETLAVIGQNCSRLRLLDVSCSGAVTEQGTTWLLLCSTLETVNLFQTSLSVQGYAQLLLGLPHLTSVGRCDSFGLVLEYIDKHRSAPTVLPITSLHSRDMSHEQLRLFVRFCPNAEHVNLYVDEDGHLLTPLTQLECLTELKLLACNFYSDKVDRLLWERGSSLTLLHLEHVDQLDMSALCLIAECCPRLKKLVFFSCDFVENFGSSENDRVFKESPFQHLEDLVCVSESAPNVIEFLLIHSENLRFVQFGSTAWFNDQIVGQVLGRNALRRVEEIRILRSYELSMDAVRSLLEACPRLRVLGEMDSWEAIDEESLRELREEIKYNNWDLDTYISWGISV